MLRMIIIGAGGLGREVETLCRADVANGREWIVGGFLDSRPVALPTALDVQIIGDPRTFVPAPSDLFVVAIGDPKAKPKLIASLISKGATFVSLRTRVKMAERVVYGATVFSDEV